MSRPSPRRSPDPRSASCSSRCSPPLSIPPEFSSNPKLPVIVTKLLKLTRSTPVTATLCVSGAAWIVALIPPIVTVSGAALL